VAGWPLVDHSTCPLGTIRNNKRQDSKAASSPRIASSSCPAAMYARPAGVWPGSKLAISNVRCTACKRHSRVAGIQDHVSAM